MCHVLLDVCNHIQMILFCTWCIPSVYKQFDYIQEGIATCTEQIEVIHGLLNLIYMARDSNKIKNHKWNYTR